MIKRIAIANAVKGPGDPVPKPKSPPRYKDASKGATYEQKVVVHDRKGSTRGTTVTVNRGSTPGTKVGDTYHVQEKDLGKKYQEVKR